MDLFEWIGPFNCIKLMSRILLMFYMKIQWWKWEHCVYCVLCVLYYYHLFNAIIPSKQFRQLWMSCLVCVCEGDLGGVVSVLELFLAGDVPFRDSSWRACLMLWRMKCWHFTCKPFLTLSLKFQGKRTISREDRKTKRESCQKKYEINYNQSQPLTVLSTEPRLAHKI